MIPCDFPQSNRTLKKPPGMTEAECGELKVFSDGQQCISYWRLSWRERLALLWRGHIWLSVRNGKTQPPVWLSAEKTVFP